MAQDFCFAIEVVKAPLCSPWDIGDCDLHRQRHLRGSLVARIIDLTLSAVFENEHFLR